MLTGKLLIFEGEFFRGGRLAFELFVDFANGIEVVVGAKQFAALNAKSLGDDKGFVVHPIVEMKEGFQFFGRQEVPKDDFAAGLGLAALFFKLFFNGGIEAAVDSANALHETNGIPVEVEVNEAVGVLEVEAFGKDVGGNENVDGFLRRFGAVVERGKSVDDFAALLGGAGAVDALHGAPESFAAKLGF